MGKIVNRGRTDTKKGLVRQGTIVGDRHEQRELRGVSQDVEARKNINEKYNLDWFKPSARQQDIVDAIDQYDWVGVQAPSGCGKTTTVVWKALSLLGKGYRKIIFVKNPTEAGDDQIGFLTGNESSKLEPHFDSMRGVFLDFMNKGKLESDEKNLNIQFKIPNFLLGATLSDAVVILDECQTYSPNTLKLLMERIDDSCKLIILGDRAQQYSVKKRKDGFTDLIERLTGVDEQGRYSTEPLFKYIELTSNENKRGAISKRVTELYSQ